MKRGILLTISTMLMVFLLPLKAYTNEAYVVFNNSSLMFYYDNDKANRTGDIYPIAESYGADLVNTISPTKNTTATRASLLLCWVNTAMLPSMTSTAGCIDPPAKASISLMAKKC